MERIEADLSISLEHAAKAGKVGLRMNAFAVWRVGEPNGSWRRVAAWPVVAHIGPQARSLDLAIARGEHGNRGVVSMQLGGETRQSYQSAGLRTVPAPGPAVLPGFRRF